MPNSTTTQFSASKRLLVASIAACFASAPAWANPTGPQVVSGGANFNQAGKLLTVNNTSGAIINWNTFSIGAGETTRFNQASAASSVLNRVIANDPSVLLGTLSSNGKVWLVNPAGIMVGQGAKIDVAGFIASTLNVANQDFLAGRLNFGATPNAGSIQNYGQIATPSGGSVLLVAPNIENHGIINAPSGEVILAAGQTAQLIDTGTPGVKVDITGAEGNVTNLGEIVAEAGRIGMAGVLVKNSGTLNASSVVKDGGRIFLKASQDAYVDGAGRIVATGTKGGGIEVLGNRVAVKDQAQLDASGDARGGTVRVGGDYQGKNPDFLNAKTAYIGALASIKADATMAGDGGKVIVWSDEATRAYGNISARGGAISGHGGLVETSGKRSLDVAGARVDTRASDGSAGTWLLDPADITIVGGSATGSPAYAPTGSSSSITDGDINASLATSNVSISTSSGSGGSGNITVNGYADLSAAYIHTSGSGARALTLTADGNIGIHGGSTINGTEAAPLTLNLYAGGNITHAGSISTYGSANFLSKGAISFGDTSYYGYLYSYGSPITLVANWNGSTTTPDAGASAQCAGSFCGINGRGSISSNYDYTSAVSAGAVSVKAPGNIDLTSIAMSAHGGYDHNYGGNGGAGGAVSITSSKGNLSTGSVDAAGGDAYYSGTPGTSSAVNGGTGGVGGAGGTISLSAAGTLTLGGTSSVAGGGGGSGGSGYYDYSLTIPAYTGAGGTGGAGGNAGSMSFGGASLLLSGATLNANGGSGGSGGYYGTSSGGTGASGAASPITLATAGDIKLTGSYNYVDASELSMRAGRSITFGDAISGYGGYLYSYYGAPITLIANWNGSSSAPEVASAAQCGTVFCGISGTGAINSSYYSYANANAGAVTLKAPGDIDLSNIGISANGYYYYSSVTGAVGGTGGAVSITSTQGNLTTGSINASGGGGGYGAGGSSGAANGGTGGAGGAGGVVSLSAAGTLTLAGPIYADGGEGGYGGNGYSNYLASTYVYSGTGGDGGAGGKAGTINASGASLISSGASLRASGGTGGNGGQGTTLGLSGVGGTGGNVTLAATTGDLTTAGYIDAVGGTGAYGTTGTSSAVNGGTGGVGGAGGTISLSAAGTLTLGGTTSVAGGGGGGGGSGYYDYSLATPAYTSAGGTGGAGGNAGTMNFGGTSLVLSGATLSANGGSGGSGGYYGASTGGTGAFGAASPITLATTGDIVLTGYSNYACGSQLNLFSGKSVYFGATGAGTAYGYLYASYGTPITILANWDGSTTAPDVAASGQCAGGTFCGISGSGSIDTNYNNFNNFMVNSGSVTLKAPGDIDLSGIAISASGGGGEYNNGSNGGAVSITSTKGNLTTSGIDASGGGGNGGSYGSVSAANGGMGGAGGAGGTVSLSAAGTLTLGGTTYASGGHGGSGAPGYSAYDTSTSTYVYSGTGGNGGAGGNAGTINLNGASIVASVATLHADGGTGGSGGFGTAIGLAGIGGNGGNVALTAATGDLATGYIYARGGSGGSGTGYYYYNGNAVVNGVAGGAGGAGGSVSLSAAGTLSFNGQTEASGGIGGAGGSGSSSYDTATSSTVYSGTGGNGGAGGNAGTISASGGALVLAGATLNAYGGTGGTGGQGTTTGSVGAFGTASPITLVASGDITLTGTSYADASQLNLLAGKSISFGDASGYGGSLYSYGAPLTLIANWNGSTGTPDVASAAQCGALYCGIGGSGSIYTSPYYYYYSHVAAADSGAITLKAGGPIDLKSISVNAEGGGGGNYYYYTDAREAGVGGVVTISSTQGDVTLGDVSAVGGYGRSGTTGTATAPNGVSGGAGGAGGGIHASAAGSLTLGGHIDASGGAGGPGGNGYSDTSLAIPAYTGAGGAGGAGGSAGTISLSGGSITLNNANVRALGGYPGLGSSSGTTTGANGTFGAANSLQLGTPGDMTVLGYNNLAANKVALLAGKSIILGDSAGAIVGDINSTGSDTLLVANWNGSTSTPDVATTAQCGTVFCGIGGTGSISNGYDYYGGYYYTGNLANQNGGTITLKAGGPIDLTSISVNSMGGAGGSYYYLGTQEAGNGGAVAISSTHGDVTVGDVSVVGGYGWEGAAGTVANPNGRNGRAGGAGGSVLASAAGGLKLAGTIDASGGQGGWGGDGYYDSTLATPAYTGAGGAGGVGGNAGTLNLSGASLLVSAATLHANAGAGGTGGSGTTAGPAGANGTGGGMTLNASASNLTLESGAVLNASATGDALVLAAAGNFINNAGASALSAPNGRWLVYSTNPTLDTLGGLAYNFKQYATGYSATLYAGLGSGNGVIYSVVPSLTLSLGGTTSKIYDGTTVATLSPGSVVMTGALDSDTIVLDNSTTGTYVDKNVGTGKSVSASVTLVSATNGAANVYGYALPSATASGLIGNITPATLSVSGVSAANKVYDATTLATVTGGSLSGVIPSDVVGMTGTGAFVDKNVGVAKTVNVSGITLTGAGAGNYTLSGTAASTTADITRATLSLSGVRAANKVYDSTTTASVSGGSLSGVLASDVVSIAGSGTFADKNVGAAKAVSLNGITLTGADAGNYTLTGSAATTTADITVRPLSTWTGGASGNWSVASNWDALPDLSNVTAVSVPTGTSVTYDAAAGSTNLATLTAGGLVIAGGSLNIANNLTVNSSFSRSGGTLAFGAGANANITQASGNLSMPGATLAGLSLAAPTGAITQTGAIIATTLSTQSQTGTALTDAGNKIASFSAANSGGGNIALTNTGALAIAGINNSGGNITVDNTGAVTTTGAISAPAGTVSILAHSPLTIGTGGVSASGSITLTAGETPVPTDHLSLNGVVQSTGSGSSITLSAGDDLAQNANVTSNGGAVNATALLGELSMAPAATTSTGGGNIGYTATTGNMALASLDAGSGGIALNAGKSIQAVPGFTGANLIGRQAAIVAGGDLSLRTQVTKLDVDAGGRFSITDVLTGNVITNAPVAASTAPVLDQVLSTVTSTTQPQATQTTTQTTAPPPVPPTTGGTGPQTLSSSTQTIGGSEGTFGGASSPPASSDSGPARGNGASSTGSGDKPAEAKAEAKADDKKDDKKEDKKDDKKKDEGSSGKKDDKPAPKKLATCS